LYLIPNVSSDGADCTGGAGGSGGTSWDDHMGAVLLPLLLLLLGPVLVLFLEGRLRRWKEDSDQ